MPKLGENSAADYRALFERHPQPVIIWDRANFAIIDANAAAVRQYGWPSAQLKKMTIMDIRPPSEVLRIRRALRNGAKLFREANFTHWRRNGTRFDAVINTHWLTYRGRKAALAVIRDETAHNKAAREHHASEERLRLLVDAVRDYAIFMLDENGIVTTWNEGARRLKGYEEKEIVGRHFSTFYTPADAARGRPVYLLRKAARTGRAEDRGWRVRKDGTRFLAKVTITAIRDPRGRLIGFAKVTRDTTEGDRAAEEVNLSRSIVRAEEAERRRIARELHDGVNQMLAAAKFRVQEAEELLPPGRSPRPAITQARRILEGTIQEVRRIAKNMRPVALDDLGLKAALSGVCADFRRLSGATVRLNTARLPAALDDETELVLYRIAQEALNNAARHAGARRVELKAERRGASVILSVADDGKGFARAKKGSGLKNIQERAQFLGGRCEVHSRPGAGTRVVVTMPYRP